MRLVCPNCGAQYEVPDDVIPESGRDVQCSNCGDTWFQKHPSQDRELAEELEQPLDDAHWESEAEDQPEAEPEPDATPEPEYEEAAGDDEPEAEFEPDYEPVETEAEAQPEPVDEEWDGFDEPEPAVETAPEPQPRPLDPEVRDVLREEAEQEIRARAAESSGLETQPDLGLQEPDDEASQREREARERMARMRGLSEDEMNDEEAALAAHAKRRDLLPDIDEINSTLRKETDRAAAGAATTAAADAPEKTRGFSRGFRTIILLAVLMLLVYVFANQIAEWVPAAKGVLDQYVALIDQGRLWLDEQVLKLTGYLDGLSSGAGGDAETSGN